jgi:site-specific recombinase XerD
MEGRLGSLDEVVQQLSPSDQRLVRELVFKLAGRPPQEPPIAENTQPQDLTGYVQAWASRIALQGIRPSTVKAYISRVRALLRYNPSPTPDNIEAYLEEVNRRCGPGALANIIYAIQSFYSYLQKKAIIKSNPAQDIKAPPVPLRVRDIPTASQVAQLIKAPTVCLKDKAIILTLAACGLRASELINSRRSDVDLERCRIKVIGKGNKQRIVPIAKQALDVLQVYLNSVSNSEWLFQGKTPDRPYAQSALNERFISLSQRAGIRHVSPHQLRHYFASFMLNHGVSLKDVSQLMGHASPSVTANVYWHLLDEPERLAAYEQHNPLQDIDEQLVRQATEQLGFDFKADT